MNNIKLTLSVDKASLAGMDSLPRAISVSALVRVMVKAATMNDRDFERYKSTNAEARLVRDYLKPRLARLLS